LGKNPASDQIVNVNNTTQRYYKKYTSQKHFCNFRCGWCELLGRSIIEKKYKDFGNILLEDDMSYNFFGREMVK
jgi:hypothetical protein